jgi:hypothetical protein
MVHVDADEQMNPRAHRRLLMLTTEIGHFVGADSSRPAPIYRPMVLRWASQADKSAVRQ